jgi:hypothetical protein
VVEYSYCVIFRIRHPSIDPREITMKLGMKPHRFWKAGERRTTPGSRALKGNFPDSLWSHHDEYEGRSRNFFERVDRLAIRLEPHNAFLHDISASGGQCEIYIQLPGSMNIGDSVHPKTLRLLADLNILLSAEVFPNWKNTQKIE